ncbi:MAG: hypothetical protein ACOYVD_19720 [Bacillota bacterium]
MKKIFATIIIIFLILLAGCSTKTVETPPQVNNEKPIPADNQEKSKEPQALTKEQKEEWMSFLSYVNAVSLPEFKQDEDINDKTLISFSLYHILKNQKDFIIETDDLNSGEFSFGELPKIGPDEVDKASLQLFGRTIKHHQSLGSPLIFEKGHYWILPHGPGEIFAAPKIVDYQANGQLFTFKVEYYNYDFENGYVLEDGTKLSQEEFRLRLLDKEAQLAKYDQPFKVVQITLKKDGNNYSIIENIDITPRETSEIFPSEKDGFFSLKRRSKIYETAEWHGYNPQNSFISYTIDFPENWLISHTVFNDENNIKKAELIPPVQLQKGQQLLDNWGVHPDHKLILREKIEINKLPGERIVVEVFPDGGTSSWYAHYYYLQAIDKVFSLVFYENEPEKLELHYEILASLKY